MLIQKALDPSSEKFYLLSDSSLAVKKKKHPAVWDPWPVDNLRDANDKVFIAAKNLLKQRNYQCVDNLVDRIILLPASSAPDSKIQGGSDGMWLYSVRSPSVLPIRIILWMTPGGKVMVRQGPQSLSFTRFISSWPDLEEHSKGPCKHFQFWMSVSITDRLLQTVPENLRQDIHDRWWAINGFRFLDLPFELREMVLKFAFGCYAVPYARTQYRRRPPPEPNMSIARVNTQLHREVQEVLIAHTTFLFTHYLGLFNFYEVSERTFRMVRYIEFDMSAIDLLDIFGVRMVDANFRIDRAQYRLEPSAWSSALRSVCEDSRSLRIFHIKFPCVAEFGLVVRNVCQKAYCMALWAGARAILRHVPTLNFEGSISEEQKRDLLRQHAADREEFILDEDEYRDWQIRTLKEWYAWNYKPETFAKHAH